MYICLCHNIKDSDDDEKKKLAGTSCGNCLKTLDELTSHDQLIGRYDEVDNPLIKND